MSFNKVVCRFSGYAQSYKLDMERDPLCKMRNAYYEVMGSCDKYIECRDYQAAEMICLEGLYFNPKTEFPYYPCGYPSEVSCVGRGTTQLAVPTNECPHQYGFFPSPKTTAETCGFYRMCVGGKAIEMECAVGLAFDIVSAQCRWPEEVPSCNSPAFLGFQCPTDSAVKNYKFEGNCAAFFSCDKGNAHVLQCDAGLAFDANLGRCVDNNLVNCDNINVYRNK
ncbi:hypothetical protein ACJJTC_010108 [Scirpophaga incertulas]